MRARLGTTAHFMARHSGGHSGGGGEGGGRVRGTPKSPGQSEDTPVSPGQSEDTPDLPGQIEDIPDLPGQSEGPDVARVRGGGGGGGEGDLPGGIGGSDRGVGAVEVHNLFSVVCEVGKPLLLLLLYSRYRS